MIRPAWLDAAVDQRLALMSEYMDWSLVAGATVVMTPLTEPGPDASPLAYRHWDKSCDNCGRFCPDELLCGQIDDEMLGHRVVITFGACRSCMEVT